MNKEKLEKIEKIFSENFDKRYGKANVVRLNGEPKKDVTSLKIECDGDEYEITEYRKEGLTEKVIIKYGDKEHSYKRYLDAEVHIADVIGEKRWAHSQKDIHSGLQKQ